MLIFPKKSSLFQMKDAIGGTIMKLATELGATAIALAANDTVSRPLTCGRAVCANTLACSMKCAQPLTTCCTKCGATVITNTTVIKSLKQPSCHPTGAPTPCHLDKIEKLKKVERRQKYRASFAGRLGPAAARQHGPVGGQPGLTADPHHHGAWPGARGGSRRIGEQRRRGRHRDRRRAGCCVSRQLGGLGCSMRPFASAP